MTKNILTMAALVLMTVACNNEDFTEQPIEQPVVNKEEIMITATLAPKGEDSGMRAVTDDGTTITSDWAVDEEIAILFNDGSNDLKRVATVTDVTAGVATITFTIPAGLANNTACKLVYPASAAKADNSNVDTYANLLAAQDGTLNANLDVRVGDGTIQTTTPGLTVTTQPAAQYAIFKFTLGSAIDATHPLVIKDNTDAVITTVTPTASTTTAYVALEPATTKYFKFTATTAESKIISKSSTATIVAGKCYQTTLAVPALGDLYYSDGTYSTTLQAGKTAIGVIAYLGTDNFTENGTNVGGNTFAGHGLVMCLKNAASGVAWSTEYVSKFSGQEVTDVTGLKRTENVSGYTNTATLTVDEETAAKYPAASAAKNYTTLTAPATGTTGWFLPSAQQWVKMIEGLGELADGAPIFPASFFDNDHTAVDKWEAALAKAGTAGTDYDSMIPYLWYWSSSEWSAHDAVSLNVDATNTGVGYGFTWYINYKDNAGSYRRVRPVLAF